MKVLMAGTIAIAVSGATPGTSSASGGAKSATAIERIAWYGTLESALDEAARTQRPIFLLAARPCASQVSGFW